MEKRGGTEVLEIHARARGENLTKLVGHSERLTKPVVNVARADGWVRSGVYYLELGGWTIAKVTVRDVPTYELWQRKEYMGVFLSADEAKAAMKTLSAGDQLYAPIF